MANRWIQQLNIALAEAIGLSVKGTRIVGFTLRVRVDQVPRLAVMHHWTQGGEKVEHFDLTLRERPTPSPEPPLGDLDAACARALERVNVHVEQMASRALAIVRSGLPRSPEIEAWAIKGGMFPAMEQGIVVPVLRKNHEQWWVGE